MGGHGLTFKPQNRVVGARLTKNTLRLTNESNAVADVPHYQNEVTASTPTIGSLRQGYVSIGQHNPA